MESGKKSSNKNNKSVTSYNGYTRPKVTQTDQLTKEQINEKLLNYSKVTDISKVSVGTHIRYFTKIKNEMKFRSGGNLISNKGLPDYIILSNGRIRWSVQTNNTIFYRKMDEKELEKEYVEIINEKTAQYKELKKEYKILEKEYNVLATDLSNLKKENDEMRLKLQKFEKIKKKK